MENTLNTTPLLQTNSDCDSEDEIIQSTSNQDDINISNEDDNKPLFKPSEPKDKYHMAYLIFYLLGMVTLLPWNFFITADDYWMYKFRATTKNVSSYNFMSHDKRTPLQAGFTSYLSVASSVPNIIFLIVNTALSQKISLNKRINCSLFVILILFIMTTVFVKVNTDSWQEKFFVLTISTVVLLNVSSAILSGSIFGIIGKFSPKYITATLGGQALGGIFAALAEIIALSIGASSVHSAFVYFMVGNVTILLSIVSYIVLSKSVFFKFYLYEKGANLNEFQNELVKPRIICYKSIIKKIWSYGITMFFTFAVTLTVYPAVTVLIESDGKGKGNKWNDVFFVPTIAYFLFSVGDYLGRILAGKLQKPKKRNVLLTLSLARILLAPLLMLCNAQPRHYLPVVFDKDYQYIIILLIFALSNGYLANMTAICAPRVVEQHEKETASSMMTVFMGVGLAFGSSLSLVTVKLL